MPRKPIVFSLDFMIKDIFPRFTVKQFDDVSFNITPLNQGSPYDTTNMTGKIFVGVNNDMFMQTTGITVSSDNINVLLDRNMLQKQGRAYAEIELTDEAGTITSSSFIFDIDPKIGEGGQIPGEYEGFVVKYERLIAEFRSQINAAVTNANTSVTNAINKCNTDITNTLNSANATITSTVDKANTTITNTVNSANSTISNTVSSANATITSTVDKANTDVTNTISRCNTSVDTKLSGVDDAVYSKLSVVDGLVTAKINDFTTVSNAKLTDVENRFQRLTASQQGASEVIDARQGQASLLANLNRIETKATETFETITSNYISATNTNIGYAQNVEIYGNTYQDPVVLSDIRSVGTQIAGQTAYEIPLLSTGKNLFDGKMSYGTIASNGLPNPTIQYDRFYSINFIKVSKGMNLIVSKNGVAADINYHKYDSNKNYLSYIYKIDGKLVVDFDGYIKIHSTCALNQDLSTIKVQIEQGTVSTTYEPYVSNQITILSPTQLEKVGTVSDRIICVNGVWGVEKNVVTEVLYGNENYTITSLSGTSPTTLIGYKMFNYANTSNLKVNSTNITSTYTKNANVSAYYTTTDCIGINNDLCLYIVLDKATYPDVATLKSKLNLNNLIIKGEAKTPTFIPLPNDQQVILKTFANKTNIFFGTEIEGTIKADVPKSLGATVNTHTTQIDSLNSELDRVKKLEESTTSTVVTETDFTVVDSTTNGYFEDVKLEGKTKIVDATNVEVLPGTVGATLKSVGDGVDEIVVSSVSPNFFDGILRKGTLIGADGSFVEDINSTSMFSYNYIDVCGGTDIKLTSTGARGFRPGNNLVVCFYDVSKKYLYRTFNDLNSKLTIPYGARYIRVQVSDIDLSPNYATSNYSFAITRYSSSSTSNIYRADKKRLLYYDTVSKTWLKPTLRSASATVRDSVSKSSDNKYYYYKNCDLATYKGTETWTLNDSTYSTVLWFTTPRNLSKASSSVICDKFKNVSAKGDYEGIFIDATNVYIGILKTKCTDLATFKTWLTSNNVNFVFELNTKFVYECTNIDLISYSDETNCIVTSGAIAPTTTLKVQNNLANVVGVLKEKVSLLENRFTDLFKLVLAGNMQSLAYSLYPEDFPNDEEVVEEVPPVE